MSPWILDVIFFVILLLGLLFGTWSGFVKGLCKLAGTIFALFVSISFCNPVKNLLEDWFGLTTAIANGLGETAASWLALGIAFLALFLLVKVCALLIGSIGSALANSCKLFAMINRTLGAVLGLVEALIFIYLVLTVCYWINAEALNTFILQSSIVGKIYSSEWFIWAANFKYLDALKLI